MKKLFILLALIGMFATACEDNGVNEPTNNPTETPDDGNDENPDDGNDEKPDDGNDEKPEDNTPEDKTQPIKFIDNIVKSICIINWDTNGDAELSYEEAAAVTNLGTVFKGTAIISFTELAYFTGLIGIANEAFADCKSLKQIELPHNIPSIGYYAFSDCTSLTSVTIGDSVTEIGWSAFSGCTSLTSFFCKFASEDNRCLIVNGNLIAFAPAGVADYTIPDSVTSIGYYAFSDCTSLTSVTIGDSVTEIGWSAFSGCTSLTSFFCKFASEDNRCLIVNGNLIAFAPAGVADYTIPDSVTSIGYNAFSGCTSLESITIPDSVALIGDAAFWNCELLTSVTIGNGVTAIGDYTFYKCTSLTSVTIPDSVTLIGEWAFASCDSLEHVTIGDRVTSIGAVAFENCTSLTSVTIPDSVTEIGWGAFSGCTSLTSVTIGDSVTEIGYGAFSWCSSLASVYCKPITPPTMEGSAFSENASGRKIYVPTESVEAYKSAAGWCDYASDIVGYEF